MGLSFSEAVKGLAEGRCIRRGSWNRGLYLRFDSPKYYLVDKIEVDEKNSPILQMFQCQDNFFLSRCKIGEPRPLSLLEKSHRILFNISQYSAVADDWEVFELKPDEEFPEDVVCEVTDDKPETNNDDGGDNDGEVQ